MLRDFEEDLQLMNLPLYKWLQGLSSNVRKCCRILGAQIPDQYAINKTIFLKSVLIFINDQIKGYVWFG